jgi:hypothetical protein
MKMARPPAGQQLNLEGRLNRPSFTSPRSPEERPELAAPATIKDSPEFDQATYRDEAHRSSVGSYYRSVAAVRQTPLNPGGTEREGDGTCGS